MCEEEQLPHKQDQVCGGNLNNRNAAPPSQGREEVYTKTFFKLFQIKRQ